MEQVIDLSTATPKEKAEEVIRILHKKLAKDIRWIDVSGVSEITDYYIIASGRSTTHVKSLAGDMQFEAEKRKLPLHHLEGRDGGNWLLLDFGDLIVHVFDRETRAFYNIERLYKEENFISTEALTAEVEKE